MTRTRGLRRGFEPRFVSVLVVSLVVAAAAAVRWSGREAEEPDSAWPDAARREVERVVGGRYVEPITPAHAERLFDSAMRGYVEELDPFSRYFNAAEKKALEEDTSGRFGGIGVHVEAVPAGLLVTAVRRGGPADRAHVEPGETIERVGTVPLAGRSRDAMIDMVKGEAGTRVELTVRTAAASVPRTIEVERALIESDSVPVVRRIDGTRPVGYVRLAQFSDTTGAETRDALRSLASQGIGAVVLDLRRNLGGVVQAAVDVAALLVPEGTLVCTARSRDGSREYRTSVRDGFEPLALPVVVLVDGSSASASEILAGALQDHGRAVLVGERTYGKFVMQTLVPLAERGALVHLTTAHYETPNGRCDQRDPGRELAGGLMPDLIVPLPSREEDEALRAEFARQSGPAWKVLAGREVPAAPDRQLAAALALIRGEDVPAEPVPPRTN